MWASPRAVRLATRRGTGRHLMLSRIFLNFFFIGAEGQLLCTVQPTSALLHRARCRKHHSCFFWAQNRSPQDSNPFASAQNFLPLYQAMPHGQWNKTILTKCYPCFILKPLIHQFIISFQYVLHFNSWCWRSPPLEMRILLWFLQVVVSTRQ